MELPRGERVPAQRKAAGNVWTGDSEHVQRGLAKRAETSLVAMTGAWGAQWDGTVRESVLLPSLSPPFVFVGPCPHRAAPSPHPTLPCCLARKLHYRSCRANSAPQACWTVPLGGLSPAAQGGWFCLLPSAGGTPRKGQRPPAQPTPKAPTPAQRATAWPVTVASWGFGAFPASSLAPCLVGLRHPCLSCNLPPTSQPSPCCVGAASEHPVHTCTGSAERAACVKQPFCPPPHSGHLRRSLGVSTPLSVQALAQGDFHAWGAALGLGVRAEPSVTCCPVSV